jgi:hypothetical protein
MGNRLGISYGLMPRQTVRQENTNSTTNNKFLINNQQTRNNNTSFGASFGDSLIKANHWLNGGGYVRSFLVIDTCGFIFPRIFQALNRNKEEIGGPNYKAGTEEAIREFMTGPGMFLVPFSSILVAKRLMGPAVNIDRKTLDVLSEKFEGMPSDTLK